MPKPTRLTMKPTTLITKGLEPHGARLRPTKKPMDFLGVGTAMLTAKGHGSTRLSGNIRIFKLRHYPTLSMNCQQTICNSRPH
jgi:hypothetical protein